ncbi:MAG: 3-phosphoserine/phosphohydroxythreonine transaminase [Verrucomicrobiota bacterium]|nr:3-phosphoserine/phosphohydroxythreonine transaminase [Verrucomicrobiota bacterium]
MERAFNFYAGPSTLPVEVLEEAQKQLVSYNGEGLSIMETSHRSKMYDDVHNAAIADIKELLSVPDNFDVILVQGGASMQFAMIPMNILSETGKAQYINTGGWTAKAIKEVEVQGKNVEIIASSKDTAFDRIPAEYEIDPDAEYVYITSNNTVNGTQWKSFPKTGDVPLIVDASSDIFSYTPDWTNIGIYYAGAQKNAGPAGVTIVIVRKDLTEKVPDHVPTMLKYATYVSKNSMFNTPPTFSIYMLGLVMKWLKSNGGIEEIATMNEKKAKLLYDAIDNSDGFYVGHAQKDSRSLMNVSFNVVDETLEADFIAEATTAGMLGVKGHRSIGGIRASIYNAMPLEGVEAFVKLMDDFRAKNQ